MRYLIICTALLAAAPSTAWSAGDGSHDHVALFVGWGDETKRDGTVREKGPALGVEYEHKFNERWGLGAVGEVLGTDTIRDAVVAVPVSFHPGGGWRLFAGPGYEWSEKHDHWMLRTGVGYSFHVNDRWSIAPEFIADWIDGGATVWLVGVAIGYEF